MVGFCMSGAAIRVRGCFQSRVRVRSPSQQYYKKTAGFITSQQNKSSEQYNETSTEFSFNSCIPESEAAVGNRVMVVIDSTSEAKGALQWALSHTLQTHDTLILLHVSKQDGKASGEIDQRGYDLLRSTKSMCELKRPEVQVEMAVTEGKEKGATIVEEAKRLKASLLVLGHRKQSFLKRLQMVWASKKKRSNVVDYCIQNAHCMTIAVRMKNKKFGGYLITTKRHKKFWLLA